AFTAIIRVWNSTTGAVVATHARHDTPTMVVAFSPDGLYLASADTSGVIHVREAFNQLGHGYILREHTGGILGLTFSPDGTRLATGGRARTVRVRQLWQTQGYRALPPGGVPPPPRLAYSPDGTRLATASVSTEIGGQTSFRDIRIWRADTG